MRDLADNAGERSVWPRVKVAILYNPRPECQAPGQPDDTFEEYDSPETIAAVAWALGGLGVEPGPVVADRQMPRRLGEGGFQFVFNLAEGSGRRCREAIPAAVCELLDIPYTGSDALTLAVTLDKAIARRIVAADVPVAPGVLIEAERDEPLLAQLRYPVLVKPNDEGSSKESTTIRSAESWPGRSNGVAGCAVPMAALLWRKSF